MCCNVDTLQRNLRKVHVNKLTSIVVVLFILLNIVILKELDNIKWKDMDYNNRSNINGINERSDSYNNTNRVHRLRQYLRNNDANLIFENGAISADEQEVNTVPLVCYVKFVIFTSFEPTTKREIVHNNTKRNWPSLDCQIRAVLFTNNSVLAKEFRSGGWDILPIKYVSKSDTPILKHMYITIARHYKASIIGYVNADILFTSSLKQTLEFINKYDKIIGTHFMLTGKRINIEDLTTDEASSVSSLIRASKDRGTLFRTDAEDYFFTNRFFPWNSLPDLVIGRPAYDNFLLLFAKMSNFTTVDLTQTVDAIHQTVDTGYLQEKWNSTKSESVYNRFIISQKYRNVNYHAGQINCLAFETRRESNEISIHKRTKFERYCKFYTAEISEAKPLHYISMKRNATRRQSKTLNSAEKRLKHKLLFL
ncbi:unnamed protein product [Mytilus edulis]|uniref:Nucleotide-diphospho-sugar transferase domain-containing protein n=1 Tax=Mytilus edulis TaxID=6550 RepID=A0A8S3V9K5_MYTED|nr:unnamed protein product [Mytilus edulis]